MLSALLQCCYHGGAEACCKTEVVLGLLRNEDLDSSALTHATLHLPLQLVPTEWERCYHHGLLNFKQVFPQPLNFAHAGALPYRSGQKKKKKTKPTIKMEHTDYSLLTFWSVRQRCLHLEGTHMYNDGSGRHCRLF